ncbi:DHH family phosphoesterase [Caminicella sporogenes]|uniref:DHH family phosphoesterase n=1 Tax=Caminicella sporogenes TaxID=166485 RepID=UPI0025416833|nr:bifunctional oligoribonuclease/PAP phosphatase NrnA [Caminicella sporogenes]WIF94683.1 bifunctional oligoribonuclease/PAP phosphatase NrnA [Caminicella sporogenes]
MNNYYLELFEGRKNIIILPHILPDGDTIGSSIALFYALKKLEKRVYIILNDKLPSNLKFLNANSKIITTEDFEKLSIKPDLIITVDSSDIDRLGDRAYLLDLCSEVLNIDHHSTNTNYGKYNLVNSKAAACGEIIYELLKKLKIYIDKDIATALYVALSTDTGSFKYSNTTPSTLRIAADLIEKDIDFSFINTELYQNKPINKIKLLSDVLNSLELHFDGKLAVIYVTNDMLKKNKIDISDTDGIIEYARDIEGVNIAVLLKEFSDNTIKVSLRSKYDFDVSIIAKKFGGGGHKKAAGCTIYDTIDNVKNILLNTFRENFR